VYTARDVAEELRDLRDSFEYSEEELEQIESRLDVIHRLRRKYGATVNDILEYGEKARQELEEIEFSDEHLERLQKQAEAAEKEATAAALLVRESRQKAAVTLSDRILSELHQLDMPRVQFQCEFSEIALSDNGMDAVHFLMSANAGESLRPMSKVASGGELARIMLAMKNVLAEQDEVATLIFDEVDAGVSGRAAQKVAEKLSAVAKNKQVLCVTHLPQIAAMADTHFSVEKSERDGRTFTQVERLDYDRRVQELARLTGGAAITPTLLDSARELLDSAETVKANR
jgi:DNA repair protein RecN (Recombination protein N)